MQNALMQVMVRKDADGGSALMLYRKKPEEALQATEPMFIAAPPAEAATEVCPTTWKLYSAIVHGSQGILCLRHTQSMRKRCRASSALGMVNKMPALPLQVTDTWLEEFRTKLTDVSGLQKAIEDADGSKGLPHTNLLIDGRMSPHLQLIRLCQLQAITGQCSYSLHDQPAMHCKLIAQYHASKGFCCSHEFMMQTCSLADAEADSAALAPAKAGRRLWLHADINSSPGMDWARQTVS